MAEQKEGVRSAFRDEDVPMGPFEIAVLLACGAMLIGGIGALAVLFVCHM